LDGGQFQNSQIKEAIENGYTKTKAFVRENTGVVFLDGIGNCDVRNVVSGSTCSLDSVNFDKTFNHRW
jgi:hypothetical protein